MHFFPIVKNVIVETENPVQSLILNNAESLVKEFGWLIFSDQNYDRGIVFWLGVVL